MSDRETEEGRLESKIVRKTMRVTDEGGRKLVDETVIFDDLETPRDEISGGLQAVVNRAANELFHQLEERLVEELTEEAEDSLDEFFGIPPGVTDD